MRARQLLHKVLAPSPNSMPISIRSRLLLLVLSVLMPAIIGAAWLILRAYEVERQTLERNLYDTTRALSRVVDGELTQRATIARVLSGSRMIDGDDGPSREQLRLFEQQARFALRGLDGWLQMSSPTMDLLDTRTQPALEPRPRAMNAPALLASPQVGALTITEGGTPPYAAIVQPVRRDGRTLLNLTVTILPAELQRIIDQQRLPGDWVATVLDARGVVVARHPGGLAFTGRQATPDIMELLRARSEGEFESVSLDGTAVVGHFSTSGLGWTYMMAVPQEQMSATLPRPVLQLLAGTLVLLGAAVLSAFWVAQRIIEPVNSLRASATRMQAGLPVERRATGIEECDGVVNALADAADAMQQTQAELERQVAQAVANTRSAEQRVSLHQRMEALGRLTGGVAHDFNNLLGVVSNSAHLIQRHGDSPEIATAVGTVLRAVEGGSRLTQHLLRFSGRHTSRPGVLNLAALLPDVQELLKVVMGKRVEVAVSVAPGTHAVGVDASELELALINLALNARDALPGGGHVWIDARNAAPEELVDLPPGAYVVIGFSDDGVGIDDSVVDRVFEPFFTTKPMGQGSGLGLSQVHGFCVQAGGQARVASTPGLGTSITLLLPVAAGATEVAPPPAAPQNAQLQGTRVLLVEDNEELANVTATLLTWYGARVEHANSPAQALRRVDSGDRFDVVLSDVVMPGGTDGVALAHALRQRLPQLPIVLISGYSNTLSDVADFTVLGKPCTPEELVRTLTEAMAQAPGAAPAQGDVRTA